MHIQMCRKRFTIRNCLVLLQRLKTPMICYLQAGGISWWCSLSSNPKAQEQEEPMVQILIWVQRPKVSLSAPKFKNQKHWHPRAGEELCPSSSRESRWIVPCLILPFCFIQVINRLDNAYLHWWESVIFSTQSTNSNADFFWNDLHRHTWEKCFINCVVIP